MKALSKRLKELRDLDRRFGGETQDPSQVSLLPYMNDQDVAQTQ
jgi:hypothetical protein